MAGFPQITIIEQGMREGMQIESAAIPAAEKIRLLDALSATGLKNIVVGSFVSPRWVPQMADVEEIIKGFTPVEGVNYTALVLNQRGIERRARFMPPLSPPSKVGTSRVHVCDVFVQRNAGRTIAQEIEMLPAQIEAQVKAGVTEAMVAVNAAWGSNWLGEFSEDQRMETIQLQMDAWAAAGIPTTGILFGDPMSWNTPGAMESQIRRVLAEWPEVTTINLHLHNARGMAPISAYVALKELDERHRLIVDTAIGGLGGCPYGGNGRLSKMIPTEDFVHMLEGEGIRTGVDLAALIECVVMAEEIVGHELWGHVSKAGPRPYGADAYPMDMPFVETFEEAQHFRLGPDTYAGCLAPWKQPITSAARDEFEARLAASAGVSRD